MGSRFLEIMLESYVFFIFYEFFFELYKVGIFVLLKFENELEIIIGDIS